MRTPYPQLFPVKINEDGKLQEVFPSKPDGKLNDYSDGRVVDAKDSAEQLVMEFDGISRMRYVVVARNAMPGIVCCNGPNGESDPEDETYWVQQAKPSLVDGKVVFFSAPDGWIRKVTNQFECGTHNVNPGTDVTVFSGATDAGEPVYWMVAGAEGCGTPCPPPSSSSSQSSSSESSSSESSSSESSNSESSNSSDRKSVV
jgi:hypothetical protein